MADNWSREEVEAAVADYFVMLTNELSGKPYNKAEHNRQLQLILRNRPKGSIERKHQNISAILIELGFPYINGYKPLRNYQQLLREVVEDRLVAAETLNQTIANMVEAPESEISSTTGILPVQVEPPTRDKSEFRVHERSHGERKPVLRNYLELESRNRTLGLAGEEMIIHFAHERLWRAGKRTLAERLEHVSTTQGDHLGYDIHSFEEDGRDRLIEVKTTRFGPMTPFFVSRNELGVSISRSDEYQIYRLFSFNEHPKLFVLGGSISSTCELEAVSYSVLPK
jgi:Domain of unknown function (DUF3883)